jgi:hypothetical protein
MWSLARAGEDWKAAIRLAAERDVVLQHPERGPQTTRDVALTNAHDAYHHVWDIRRSMKSALARQSQSRSDIVTRHGPPLDRGWQARVCAQPDGAHGDRPRTREQERAPRSDRLHEDASEGDGGDLPRTE